jgi:hypothetical protein
VRPLCTLCAAIVSSQVSVLLCVACRYEALQRNAATTNTSAPAEAVKTTAIITQLRIPLPDGQIPRTAGSAAAALLGGRAPADRQTAALVDRCTRSLVCGQTDRLFALTATPADVRKRFKNGQNIAGAFVITQRDVCE